MYNIVIWNRFLTKKKFHYSVFSKFRFYLICWRCYTNPFSAFLSQTNLQTSNRQQFFQIRKYFLYFGGFSSLSLSFTLSHCDCVFAFAMCVSLKCVCVCVCVWVCVYLYLSPLFLSLSLSLPFSLSLSPSLTPLSLSLSPSLSLSHTHSYLLMSFTTHKKLLSDITSDSF